MSTGSNVIVVGVDGTPASRAALDLALEEGLARAATVEIITTWVWHSPYEGVQSASTSEEARAAEAMQDEIVQAALDRLPTRPIILQTVAHDYAGKVLVARAEHALMLVVGNARKGRLTRTMLGSVSEYCVRHSPVPVLVVPDPALVHHASSAEDTPASRPAAESNPQPSDS